jgi:hypothetical protein
MEPGAPDSARAATIPRVRAETLDRRALNRATLARQLLLERSELPALDAVEHLVGLQAQVPLDPYVALWSRLRRFRPAELSELLETRRVVRTVVMRATIHLVGAEDCLLLRPLMQPVLDRELQRHRDYAPLLRGVDLDRVLRFARDLVGECPRTGPQLRAALAERFPEHDAAALAYACRNLLALVQVPPRGLWGRTAQVTSTTAESWLGRPLARRPSLGAVVLRYLAAFGPASVGDVSAWCRLTGLREVVERLRPQLRTFRDERGRELFDLPDAPRPGADAPAPVRFLPEYDNALLSHDDRSRFAPENPRVPVAAAFTSLGQGAVLVDGTVAGSWQLEREAAALVVRHVRPLPRRGADAIGAEGRRLLRLLATEAATHDVRLEPVF